MERIKNQTNRNVRRDTGIYSILMELKEEREIEVGKLGHFLFPQGYYIYTGKAMRNLTARINRHKRGEKNSFWHIDYFLNFSLIKTLLIIPVGIDLECLLNEKIMNSENTKVVAPGFGSSDCQCLSHLIFSPTSPLKKVTTIFLDFRQTLDIDYVVFEF